MDWIRLSLTFLVIAIPLCGGWFASLPGGRHERMFGRAALAALACFAISVLAVIWTGGLP